MDAWEERFYGNGNAVISEIKGGKSVRVEVYCETKEDAEAIKEQWGGSVRELKQQNWVAMSVVEMNRIKRSFRFLLRWHLGQEITQRLRLA